MSTIIFGNPQKVIQGPIQSLLVQSTKYNDNSSRVKITYIGEILQGDRHNTHIKNRPGCLFIRTFLLKSSYRLYPLMYVKMLETVCIPPLTSLICEIKTLLILWKYQVILVIAYIFIIKVINYSL